MTTLSDRAAREAAAYDDEGVWERSHAWHVRVEHVFFGANSQRAERRFAALMAEKAAGGRVLDVGCGTGATTEAAIAAGAEYALGLEVSQDFHRRALERARPGTLEFRLADAQQPLEGEFDLIFGRSVLHHIDFRRTLPAWYERNLRPGGRLLFMEPASHPMTLAFHLLVRSAHTPDEFTLLPRDLAWIRAAFPRVRVLPVNLLSFPAGVASSFLFDGPDNALMRAADRVDAALELRPRLAPFGRQVVIAVDRP